MSTTGKANDSTYLRPDQAITLLEQDRLGRKDFAEHLAHQLLAHADPSPLIVALYAPWGTGKSSLLNLVKNAMESQPNKDSVPIIVRFNPWNFSSVDQLITMFFSELYAGLGRKENKKTVKKIGAALETLAVVVRPAEFVFTGGLSMGTVSKIMKRIGSKLEEKAKEVKPLYEVKEEVNSLMDQYGRRVFVLIDDIDRLEPESMLMMFKLVRLVADFRNTTYVLAIDRQHVENVLSNRYAINGRRYLEKIVQVAFDIPPPEPSVLAKFLSEELDREIAFVPEDQWASERWQELYHVGLRHFFRTVRDIIRYVNGVHLNLKPLLGEVNVVDFLGLEAIRTFSSDIYEFIRENQEIFAPASDRDEPSYSINTGDILRSQVEAQFDKLGPSLSNACKETCNQLFPKWQYLGSTSYLIGDYVTWRREKRICSPDFFDRYFLLRVPEREISETRFRLILSQSRNREALQDQLNQLISEGKIERFLERLEDFTPNIWHDEINIILTTLFDVGDSLPSESKNMMSTDPRLHVAIVASRLLLREDDLSRRGDVARIIAESTTGLSTLVRWISVMSPYEETHEDTTPSRRDILSREQVDVLHEIALNRIRTEAGRGDLSKRPDLANILFRWKDWAGDTEPKDYVVDLVATEDGLLDFLVGFLSEIRSTTVGSHVERRIPHIRRSLVAHFVDPESLVDRVQSIKENKMDDLSLQQQTAIEVFLNPQHESDW